MRATLNRVPSERRHTGDRRKETTLWLRTVGCLVTLALGILAAPFAADAQQPGQLPRIGVLSPGSSTDPVFIEAFRQGLRDLGYVEGHNIRLEYRFAEGQFTRLPELAAALVQLPVDVLITDGAGALAAKHATATIPIVFATFANPVEEGLVASLARPGGNVTGSSSLGELAGKRLELLMDVVPSLRRMAILWNPGRPGFAIQIKEIQALSARVGIHLEVLEVRSPQEFDDAFLTMGEKGVGAVTVIDDAMFFTERTRLAALAAQSQIPAMYGNRGFVAAGGLLAYGPNFPELNRRAATFVDKILKGAKPADLPVEQPMKFELVINLKTAKALGLTIPPSLLFQADEVIQ
jgi:putative tryptophan/tyrosine transport system substrate-binding protein